MPGSTTSHEQLAALRNAATHLRIESVRSTSVAGSGHPSSCCSAADIVEVRAEGRRLLYIPGCARPTSWPRSSSL